MNIIDIVKHNLLCCGSDVTNPDLEDLDAISQIHEVNRSPNRSSRASSRWGSMRRPEKADRPPTPSPKPKQMNDRAANKYAKEATYHHSSSGPGVATRGDVFGDMEKELNDRKQKWEQECEEMRESFFKAPLVGPGSKDHLKTLRSCCNGSMRKKKKKQLTYTSESQDYADPDDNLCKNRVAANEVLCDGGGSGPTLRNNTVATSYETSSTGKPVFRAIFDMTDFDPEHIKVVVNPDNTLHVRGRYEQKSDNKSMSKEFSRQVTLPVEVEVDQLTSMLNPEGQLVVEAPVGAPKYTAVRDSSLALSSTTQRPQSRTLMSSSTAAGGDLPDQSLSFFRDANFSSVQTRGVLATNENGEQIMQWNFPLDSKLYQPHDIKIKVANGKLKLSAFHEEKNNDRTAKHEFNRDCDISDHVDERTISAFFREDTGLLQVEAKLKPEYQFPTITPFNRGVKLDIQKG